MHEPSVSAIPSSRLAAGMAAAAHAAAEHPDVLPTLPLGVQVLHVRDCYEHAGERNIKGNIVAQVAAASAAAVEPSAASGTASGTAPTVAAYC